jgi:hypothetical protein
MPTTSAQPSSNPSKDKEEAESDRSWMIGAIAEVFLRWSLGGSVVWMIYILRKIRVDIAEIKEKLSTSDGYY